MPIFSLKTAFSGKSAPNHHGFHGWHGWRPFFGEIREIRVIRGWFSAFHSAFASHADYCAASGWEFDTLRARLFLSSTEIRIRCFSARWARDPRSS